jgi:Flp pilus assembly protein TadG
VLVITAAAIVVLLLVAALVIDIGFSVMLRRQEQNAADPGALAAARFIRDDQTIDMTQAEAAACHYARRNGFFPAASEDSLGANGCVPANDPKGASLEVNYPPDARAGQYQGHSGFVQVVIGRQQETFFGKVIGRAFITVVSDAVAARQRGETNTHSLVALDPESCSAAKVHGTGFVRIYPVPGYSGPGGYVQVNSECGTAVGDDDCANGTGALKIDGTAGLYAPKTNVHGSCQSNSDEPHGVLDEGASQIGDPLFGLVPPTIDTSVDGAQCGAGGQATQATGSRSAGCGNNPLSWFESPAANCAGMPAGYKCVELSPGVYYGGWDLKGAKYFLKLSPGIYIIAGGGIDLTTDAISSVMSAGTNPAPVLIYNTDNPAATCPGSLSGCQGDLTLGTAQSTLKLTGLLADQPCPPVTTTGGCPFGGMVIWYDGNASQAYDGEVTIEGGAALYISGTIYAPKAHVKIEGNAGTNCGTGTETQVAAVQIIAWDWDIGGTGDLCMPYDPTKLYKLNQQGLVH